MLPKNGAVAASLQEEQMNNLTPDKQLPDDAFLSNVCEQDKVTASGICEQQYDNMNSSMHEQENENIDPVISGQPGDSTNSCISVLQNDNGFVAEEKQESDQSSPCEQDDSSVRSPYEQLDNCSPNVCEDVSNSVITAKSTLNFFPDKEKPDLDFYMKSSCDAISKNLNVNAGNTCSKTDKELFKVFQKNSDSDGCYKTISTGEDNVS